MPPTKIFIKFEEVFLHPRKITRVLEIYSVAWNNHLGTIKWYAPWRKYCFYPGDSTVFDSKCLQDIQDKIDALMSERVSKNGENIATNLHQD